MSPGLLDTNVFIHAHTTDELSEECRRFLAALERGSIHARLEPLVVHELSYALRHYIKGMTRDEIAEYILAVLQWPGIDADKDLLSATLDLWRNVPDAGFVDAYLAAIAKEQGCPVFSKNVKDFRAAGANVPAQLPH